MSILTNPVIDLRHFCTMNGEHIPGSFNIPRHFASQVLLFEEFVVYLSLLSLCLSHTPLTQSFFLFPISSRRWMGTAATLHTSDGDAASLRPEPVLPPATRRDRGRGQLGPFQRTAPPTWRMQQRLYLRHVAIRQWWGLFFHLSPFSVLYSCPCSLKIWNSENQLYFLPIWLSSTDYT